jgi:hypothetical protein
MYNRGIKDNYRKQIEELISGKRSNSSRDVINIDDSDNTNNNDTNNNDTNDNDTNNNDTNMSNTGNTDNIRIVRWTPTSTIIEGIRKYLEANKISII